MSPAASDPHVVVLGGGFGGLYAAKVLGKGGARVTVVDRRNFHLFQPLLYQVATGGLSPGDIASPIRAVLSPFRRVRVLHGEAVDVDPAGGVVLLDDGERLSYDALIVATGSRTSYFGHDDWEVDAPGLKTVEDALEVRRRVLVAFERAEREPDAARRGQLLTFVVVGGGPTGVEMAGAIAELARATLARDFRAFDPRRTAVLLVEGDGRILPAFPENLSRQARRSLERLGVHVFTDTMVREIRGREVTVESGGHRRTIRAGTVLWAAGVATEDFGSRLAGRFGVEPVRGGKIRVQSDLSIPGHPQVFVVGDLASIDGADGRPLPGLAPVAMQQGRYVARRILGRASGPFRYRDKGQLAVIGRNAAVADFGLLRLSGFPAWFVWLFVHITYLIEYDNKITVLVQWAFDYATRKRGARLITRETGGPT